DDQAVRGPQGEGGDALGRRLRRLDRARQEDVLSALRQGRAERPEADRRGALGQISSRIKTAGGLDGSPAGLVFKVARAAEGQRRWETGRSGPASRGSWTLTFGRRRSCRASRASSPRS